ncbi:3-hydroxyacyl-[acyl-carrier-protein] dehydratase [Angulomicrobium amanitiforme]|uniref:3-hydroxyacyl-[acyl-carrier-protein] dehydratase n=3 Tax=Xanthobacteraceae TaxID=335928 RepID=A0A839Z8Z8_9HYPH|nr:3-hydroxyacyl-[acyl-carrier-protein] dehydratase [Ancylobacter tetraedralis]MDQ0510000.1 3-hydroxyacyl-[acyl-carrier-protein] dehydratase [Ancylobacter amanitiformis]
MIDKVLALDLDARTLKTANTVPEESPIFEGHFPGHPLLPGVLLFEIMAQSCGMLLLRLHNYDRMAFLASVDKGKLRTFVTPGQVIVVDARLEHDGSGYGRLKAEGRVDGKLVCNADITLKTMPFPAPELRGYLLSTAERIGMPMGEAAAPASSGNLSHV